MHLLMVADRWVVPRCVTACCTALAALPSTSLTLEDVLAIYSPGQGPIPASLLTSREFQPVLEAALAELLQLFGDVPTIVASPTLTQQLLQLPRAALLALLGSNKLTTDCEDNVLMLLSWWLEEREHEDESDSSEGEGLEEEEGEGEEEEEEEEVESSVLELMSTIRYSRLSSTYMFQAWTWLVRLKPSEEQLLELHHFRSLPAEYAQVFSSDQTLECPASWFKPQRPLSPAGSAAQLSWWEPFIVDGNVRLTAEITDKRSL
ncbi:MAG: hypothetical protein WDW38_009753 [Sanguina aurantia]